MTVVCLWATNADDTTKCSYVDVSASILNIENTEVDIVVCETLKRQMETSTEWLMIAPHGNWRQTPASWNQWLPIIQFCRHATRQVFVSDNLLPCAADKIPHGHRDLYTNLLNNVIEMWQQYNLISQMQVNQMKGLYSTVIDENQPLVLIIRLLEQHIRQFDVEPIDPSPHSGVVGLLEKTLYGNCIQNHLGNQSVPAKDHSAAPKDDFAEPSATPAWLLQAVPMIVFALSSAYNVIEAKNSQYESARVRSQYYRDNYHETIADGLTGTTGENHGILSNNDDATTGANVMNFISQYSEHIGPDYSSFIASQDTLAQFQENLEKDGLLNGIDTSGLNALISVLLSQHNMNSTEYKTEVAGRVAKLVERSNNQLQLQDFLKSMGFNDETSESLAKLRLIFAGLLKPSPKPKHKFYGLLAHLQAIKDGQWSLATQPIRDIYENGIFSETVKSAAGEAITSMVLAAGAPTVQAGVTAAATAVAGYFGIVGTAAAVPLLPVSGTVILGTGVIASAWHIFGATGANILTENVVEVTCNDDSTYCRTLTRTGSVLAQAAVMAKLNEVFSAFVSSAIPTSNLVPKKFADVQELSQIQEHLNRELKKLAGGSMDKSVLQGMQNAFGNDALTIDALSKMNPSANLVAVAAMADLHRTTRGTAGSQSVDDDLVKIAGSQSVDDELVNIVMNMEPDDLAKRALSFFTKVTITAPLTRKALTDAKYEVFTRLGLTMGLEGQKLLAEDLSEEQKIDSVRKMWDAIKSLPMEGIDNHFGSNLPLSSDHLRFVNDVTVAQAQQSVINGNTVTKQCELAQKFHSGPNPMTMQNCVIMTQSNPDEAKAVDEALTLLSSNPTAGDVARVLSQVVSGAGELVYSEFLRAIPYVLQDSQLRNQPVEQIANRVLTQNDVQVLRDGLLGAQRPMREAVTSDMLNSEFSHLARAVQSSSPWSTKLLRSLTAQVSTSLARQLYANTDEQREQTTVNGQNPLYAALSASLAALDDKAATVYARKYSTLLDDLRELAGIAGIESNSIPADIVAWTRSLHGATGIRVEEWLQKMDAEWNSLKTSVPDGYEQQTPSAVWAESGGNDSALFAELMSVRFPHAFDRVILKEIQGAIKDSTLKNHEIQTLRDTLETQDNHVQKQTIYAVTDHGCTRQLRHEYDRALATRVSKGQHAFTQLVTNHNERDIKWNRMFMPLLSFDYPLEAPDSDNQDVYGMVSTIYNTGGPHLLSLRERAREELFDALSSNRDKSSSDEWMNKTLTAAEVLANTHGIDGTSMREVIATVMRQHLSEIRSTVTATAITKTLAASTCDASTSINPVPGKENTNLVFDSLACSIMFQASLKPEDSSDAQVPSSSTLEPGFRAALSLVAHQLDSPFDSTSIDAAITNAIEAATRAAQSDELSQNRAVEQALAATAMAIAYRFEREGHGGPTQDARSAIDALVHRLARHVHSVPNVEALSNVLAMVPIIAGSKFDIAVVAAAAIGMPGTTGVEERDALQHTAKLTDTYKQIRNLLSLRESVTEPLAPVVRRDMLRQGYEINRSYGNAGGLHVNIIDLETAKDVVHTALGMKNQGQFDVEQLLDLLHPALDKLIQHAIEETKSISNEIVTCISNNSRDEHGACNEAIAIFGQARTEALKRNGMKGPNAEAAARETVMMIL